MSNDATSERSLRLLIDFPREEMSIEIKDWLDLEDRAAQAKLAKGLIALANHGGGYLLFGFSETTTGWPPSGPCPHNLNRYSQDAINNVLKRYAEPVFECYVEHLKSASGNAHVVIQVPGGHTSPIRAHGSPQGSDLINHGYYIRRPGPESALPQNGREWETLIRRCVDNDHERQVEAFRRILATLRAQPELARQIADSALGSAVLVREWSKTSMDRLRALQAGDV